MQAKVTEFVDLVDQAERAHFGVEESFGYGKPPSTDAAAYDAKSAEWLRPMMQTMGPGSMGWRHSLFTARFLKRYGSYIGRHEPDNTAQEHLGYDCADRCRHNGLLFY